MVTPTNETLERIVDSGVVAVLRGAEADRVIDIAEALHAGGVTALEITADTPGATDIIEDVSAAFADDEVLLGAGTVLDSETARAALMAGADFVVSPNLNEDVVELSNRYGAVVAPGIMTPTEATRAFEAGADLVKVFPASSLGPGHLKSMRGPLSQIPMMPTGGVDLDNVGDFVRAGAIAVGAGGALVDDEAVEAGEFDVLTQTAEAFRSEIAAAREER